MPDPRSPNEPEAENVVSSTATPMTTEAPSRSPRGGLLVPLGLALVVGAGIYYVRAGGSDEPAAEWIDPIPRRRDEPAVADGDEPERAERLRVQIVATHPHDPRAFTQGLSWHEGTLYEGTGLHTRSTIRRVALETGEVEASESLPPEVFGEGIAVVGDRIFQITWQDGIAYERRRSDLSVIRELEYEGEGWGLCYDGERLVMSDGSDELFFRNAQTFALEGRVSVTLDGEELDQLNELECVDGLVYANVWQTDFIARIDPATGRVTGWIDTTLHRGNPEGARMLEPADAERADVLNGIAWIPERGHFLVGGKEWPRLFEVTFVAAD